MKIIIHIPKEEAMREIECEEEKIRPAFKEMVRRIENILCEHQIRDTEIEVRNE
jgi:hypothetical protein